MENCYKWKCVSNKFLQTQHWLSWVAAIGCKIWHFSLVWNMQKDEIYHVSIKISYIHVYNDLTSCKCTMEKRIVFVSNIGLLLESKNREQTIKNYQIKSHSQFNQILSQMCVNCLSWSYVCLTVYLLLVKDT